MTSIEGAQGHAIMQTHYCQLADDIPGNDSNLQAAEFLEKVHAAFQNQGKNACDYGFPDAPVIDDPLHGIFNVANQKQKWTDMAKELSVERLEIVASCLEAMNGPSGQTKFVSINAPAGYGKTYLARAIASCLRGHGHSICCTATAALASVLHEGGRTAQSANGIPVSESP